MSANRNNMLILKNRITAYVTAMTAIMALAMPQLLAAQDAGAPPVQGPPSGAQSGPPESAQTAGGPPPFITGESVFDGDWVTVGIGAGLSPSYTGSDDYRPFPLPIVQGEVAGVGFRPLGPGLALDFLTGEEEGLDISFGPAFRIRSDRVDGIDDPIVELAGELDRAVEVGVAAGITKRGIGTRRDSLSFNLGARKDVAGAHDGIIIEPSIGYFAPLDRGTAVSFSLNASIVDDNYADYYFSVDGAQSAASGLAPFAADGGLQSVGASTFVAYDFDGNALNGSFSAVFIGSYSRLVGDAANTPYTSVRGDADQFFAGMGLGYTF